MEKLEAEKPGRKMPSMLRTNWKSGISWMNKTCRGIRPNTDIGEDDEGIPILIG